MNQEKNSRITLKDVAKHAGVSRSTASLTVRGSHLVANETREKVLDSIRQLGYVYDRVAANLRSHQSSTIGFIVSEISNSYFSDLLNGVHHELENAGYTVLLGTTNDDHAKQEKLISAMIENRVGGLICLPASASTKDTIDQLREYKIPLVLVNKHIEAATYDYVGIDNVVGAQMAIKHLIKKGHQKIAYLGGPLNTSTWNDRKLGVERAHHMAGYKLDKSLVIPTNATREGGIQAAQQLLSLPKLPSAAFCFNDAVALGVIQELKRNGIMTGKDIAIVGFDNISESTIITPNLSTISSLSYQLGIHSARILNQRMMGVDGDPERVILQPELIVRESCSHIQMSV